jgi:hypothetical protein
LRGSADLPTRTLAFIRKVVPFAYCDTCLALKLGVSLLEMAAALDILDLPRRRRVCYGCGRTLPLAEVRESPPR